MNWHETSLLASYGQMLTTHIVLMEACWQLTAHHSDKQAAIGTINPCRVGAKHLEQSRQGCPLAKMQGFLMFAREVRKTPAGQFSLKEFHRLLSRKWIAEVVLLRLTASVTLEKV